MFERKENIIVFVGALLSIIAVFLPYITVDAYGLFTQNVALKDAKDGYILIVLVVLTCVFLVLKNAKAFYGLAGASIAYSVYEFIDCKSAFKGYEEFIKYGAGCWLSIAGAVAIAVGLALYALNEKKNA